MRGCFSCLLILFLAVQSTFAQREGNIWYFGNNAGLDFSTGKAKPLTHGKLNTTEGCASIADHKGQVLFYTDGITIWNKAHKVMANGDGLMGDPSSTQSGIIVPKPGNRTQYYVFTVDNVAQPNGFRYSLVDLALEEGMGRVTQKNELLLAPVTEKLTAVAHENGKDVWVIVHGWNNNTFYAYLVTEKGIAAQPVLSHVGTVHNGRDNNTIGYLKASPAGSKIALAIRGMKLYELFDFDDDTGILSNPVVFQSNNYNSAYGLEFSPDGSKLYINSSFTPTAKIYQIDLYSKAVTLIGTSASSYAGAMQLGPDGKIYFSRYESPYLGVINSPNKPGIACEYVDNGVYLEGKTAAFGLPNFIQSLFHAPSFMFSNACVTEPTYFSVSDTNNIEKVQWEFDDPVMKMINMSALMDPVHIFSEPGEYTVSLNISYKNGAVKQATRTITIHSLPVVDLGKDTVLCTGQSLVLQTELPKASVRWQDGSTGTTYTVTKPGIYWVDVVTNNGCPVRDSIRVSYYEALPVELEQDQNLILCAGNTILLSIRQPTADTRYRWQDGSTHATYLVKKAGTYWVEASNACGKSIDSVRVDYTEPLPFFTLGKHALLKANETLQLQVNIPQVNYLWQDGSTESSFTVKKAGIYWVEISNSCDTRRDSIHIEYALSSIRELTIDTTICRGSTLQLDASAASSSSGYLWQDGSTQATFRVKEAGTYWVKTADKAGATKHIFNVNYLQEPQVELGENTTVCGNEQVVLHARQVISKATYLWQDGSTEDSYTVTKPGIYWVEVTNSCGTARDTVTITCPECMLADMPNVITPNNDGANDSFTFSCIREAIWQIEIYNRWGKLVFTSQHYQGEWNGSNLDNGIYYYTLKSQASTTPYKGVIHVLR